MQYQVVFNVEIYTSYENNLQQLKIFALSEHAGFLQVFIAVLSFL